MKALVEYIAKGLVDDPTHVSVEETVGMRSSVVRLRVGPKDMGRVIGREGRVANAIRALLKIAGAREDRRYILEIE
jgi:uncharacterized protein